MCYHIVKKAPMYKWLFRIIALQTGSSKWCDFNVYASSKVSSVLLLGGSILCRQLSDNCIALNTVLSALLRISFKLKYFCVNPYFNERLRKSLISPHCSILIKPPPSRQTINKALNNESLKKTITMCSPHNPWLLNNLIKCMRWLDTDII